MRLVVAAVLVDRLGTGRPSRVLAAHRRDQDGWEFPGGKVEPDENPVDALHRELAEELDLQVRVGAELLPGTSSTWPISDRYELRAWLATITAGVPGAGLDHDEVRWLSRAELDSVAWLHTDRAIVEQLRPLLAH